MKAVVHAPHTDRARLASETNASLCRYAGHRFFVASRPAESRGGLVAASLAVVSAGKLRRCSADNAETFTRGVGLSSGKSRRAPDRSLGKPLKR